ncbi:MAG: CaiB/BaiF CoA transferase family protein [Thermodesulfobacteriota bacterium]
MESDLPLRGIKVLDLGHAILGPTCGLILADMGADVIKVERAPEGDDTRRLKGFGVGFFHYFNRNKRSLALDLKQQEGKEVLERLIKKADVLLENFGPGTIDRLGFSYERCAQLNPRLIYCTLKGFMPGPYEKRPSLDNLVQMMGGLAYMTGPRGRPLRAGTSVIDIVGGMFGAMGIITALYERTRTGRGQFVRATLFEATAFLVGQHMAMAAITGEVPPPMPEGQMPWGIYDLFDTQDGEMIFLGVTSDQQWERFCEVFGLQDLACDERLRTNNDRVKERSWLIPRLKEEISRLSISEIVQRSEKASIPYAPIRRPDQLLEDPQLLEGGGLVQTVLPSGKKARLPKLPLRMDDYDFGLRREPPRVGEHTREILQEAGFSNEEIERLLEKKVVSSL